MRKAFIGSSSPILYDYAEKASKAPSDLSSSPNPILESPFGILLMFDEIYFLCRSFCPENMRNLPYVHFMDEEGLLPNLTDLNYDKIRSEVEAQKTAGILKYDNRPTHIELLEEWGLDWVKRADNHTHGLKFGGIESGGNQDLHNLVFDQLVLKKIGDSEFELITNTLTDHYLSTEQSSYRNNYFSELIVVNDIPNYLTPKGPYHPCIEEVRENKYLKEFRKWVLAQKIPADKKEIKDIQNEVENVIRQAQKDIFLKYLDEKNHYKTIGKAAIGDAVGCFIPGIGTLGACVEENKKEKQKQEIKWQGFVVSAKKQLKSK